MDQASGTSANKPSHPSRPYTALDLLDLISFRSPGRARGSSSPRSTSSQTPTKRQPEDTERELQYIDSDSSLKASYPECLGSERVGKTTPYMHMEDRNLDTSGKPAGVGVSGRTKAAETDGSRGSEACGVGDRQYDIGEKGRDKLSIDADIQQATQRVSSHQRGTTSSSQSHRINSLPDTPSEISPSVNDTTAGGEEVACFIDYAIKKRAVNPTVVRYLPARQAALTAGQTGDSVDGRPRATDSRPRARTHASIVARHRQVERDRHRETGDGVQREASPARPSRYDTRPLPLYDRDSNVARDRSPRNSSKPRALRKRLLMKHLGRSEGDLRQVVADVSMESHMRPRAGYGDEARKARHKEVFRDGRSLLVKNGLWGSHPNLAASSKDGSCSEDGLSGDSSEHYTTDNEDEFTLRRDLSKSQPSLHVWDNGTMWDSGNETKASSVASSCEDLAGSRGQVGDSGQQPEDKDNQPENMNGLDITAEFDTELQCDMTLASPAVAGFPAEVQLVFPKLCNYVHPERNGILATHNSIPCRVQVECRNPDDGLVLTDIVSLDKEGQASVTICPLCSGDHMMVIRSCGNPRLGVRKPLTVKDNDPVLTFNDGSFWPVAAAVDSSRYKRDHVIIYVAYSRHIVEFSEKGRYVQRLAWLTDCFYNDLAVLPGTYILAASASGWEGTAVHSYRCQRIIIYQALSGRQLYVLSTSTSLSRFKSSVLYLSSEGNKYVLIADRNVVSKLNVRSGTVETRVGLQGAGTVSRVVHSNGRYYVTDAASGSLKVYDDSGSLLKQIAVLNRQGEQVDGLTGLAVDDKGHLLVSDCLTGAIWVFQDDGALLRTIEPGDRKVHWPLDLSVCSPTDGHVYIVDHGNKCIKKFRYLE